MKPIGKSRGFTLLEVLLVLAIVTALAVIGMQGFRSARLRANQTVSSANLRQLAAANLLYVADHQTYCPFGDPSNCIRWHGGRSSASEPFDPSKGLLAEYLGLSRRVGTCPEFTRHLTGSQSWEEGSGGYGYNGTYLGGIPGSTFTPNRPANVNRPERTLMFATTAFAKNAGLQEYASAAPRRSVSPNWKLAGPLQPSVHFRFNGKALIAWCDGHVTAESPAEGSETNFYGGDNQAAHIGWCGPEEENGWWNPRN